MNRLEFTPHTQLEMINGLESKTNYVPRLWICNRTYFFAQVYFIHELGEKSIILIIYSNIPTHYHHIANI